MGCFVEAVVVAVIVVDVGGVYFGGGLGRGGALKQDAQGHMAEPVIFSLRVYKKEEVQKGLPWWVEGPPFYMYRCWLITLFRKLDMQVGFLVRLISQRGVRVMGFA